MIMYQDSTQMPDTWKPHGFYVGVYSTGLAYGGPEEGGWWFDSGELEEEPEFYATYAEAKAAIQQLETQYVSEGNYTSVRPGQNYRFALSEDPLPQVFPEERPFYE